MMYCLALVLPVAKSNMGRRRKGWVNLAVSQCSWWIMSWPETKKEADCLPSTTVHTERERRRERERGEGEKEI